LQTRKWQDQSGTDKYSTEVVLQGFNCQLKMLDGKPSGDSGGQRDSGGGQQSNGGDQSSQRPQANRPIDDDPDSIPF